MGKSPLISIIIPVYKVEQYIEKCCRSVFSQTYKNIEVVIVDDGTPDRSIEIIEGLLDGEFAHMKPRVKIIHQENKGLPQARKTGLQNVTGDYVIQFDSDDWISPRMIEKLAAATDDDPDVVICNYYNVYKHWNVPRREKRYDDKMEIIDAMFSHKHFRSYMWDKMVKRSIYEDGEFLTPKYGMCEDMVTMSQVLLRSNKIKFIKDRLYYYRKLDSSMSNQDMPKRNREVVLNKLDLWDFLEKNGNNPIAFMKDSYMLYLVSLAFFSNNSDALDSHPGLVDYVGALPISKKYGLEEKYQKKLKEMISYYKLYEETGDESLLPKFHAIIKKRH